MFYQYETNNIFSVLSPAYFSRETCDENLNITMCPLCDAVCDYWQLTTVCSLARATYLFDNGATVLFAIFMSLWGKLTLFHFPHNDATSEVHFSRQKSLPHCYFVNLLLSGQAVRGCRTFTIAGVPNDISQKKKKKRRCKTWGQE